MNLKERIKYLKELKDILIISKRCGHPYYLSDIKYFIYFNILPPEPLYPDLKMKKIKYNKKNLKIK